MVVALMGMVRVGGEMGDSYCDGGGPCHYAADGWWVR